jgi:hypothetical protein
MHKEAHAFIFFCFLSVFCLVYMKLMNQLWAKEEFVVFSIPFCNTPSDPSQTFMKHGDIVHLMPYGGIMGGWVGVDNSGMLIEIDSDEVTPAIFTVEKIPDAKTDAGRDPKFVYIYSKFRLKYGNDYVCTINSGGKITFKVGGTTTTQFSIHWKSGSNDNKTDKRPIMYGRYKYRIVTNARSSVINIDVNGYMSQDVDGHTDAHVFNAAMPIT